MKKIEWSFATRDGVALQARDWTPDGPARALVALVHGFDEHGERYQHVGAALAGAGYALSAFDLRGHGRSGGKRVHAESYEPLMEDVDTFLRLAGERFPGLPRFLYGHSMGGNLVLNYALRRSPALAGVVATSPWLELAKAPPAWQAAAARVASRLLGGVALPTGLDSAAISRDPAVVKAYDADPFLQGKITPRLLVSVLDAGQWALAHAGEWKLPLLLLHGDADRITSFDASRRFAEAAQGDVTFHGWPGGYHELHNDLDKAEVLKEIVAWLGKRG
jgi:alpha-beta hydrolase superfamily lysophospholipase